jgi:hypothetical protein
MRNATGNIADLLRNVTGGTQPQEQTDLDRLATRLYALQGSVRRMLEDGVISQAAANGFWNEADVLTARVTELDAAARQTPPPEDLAQRTMALTTAVASLEARISAAPSALARTDTSVWPWVIGGSAVVLLGIFILRRRGR